jgi:putative metallopeptidase-like protein
MAVDSEWRLYYNDGWLAAHTVEENATLLIHEVSHLLRDHEARKKAAGIPDHRRWNTAGDCEINDDLHEEGLPLPGDPPLPGKYGLQSRKNAKVYYNELPKSPPGTTAGRAHTASDDSGSCRPTMRVREVCRVSTGSRPSSCDARLRGRSTRRRRTSLMSPSAGVGGRARLAQAAHVAMGATRVGLWLHARRRDGRSLHRADRVERDLTVEARQAARRLTSKQSRASGRFSSFRYPSPHVRQTPHLES